MALGPAFDASSASAPTSALGPAYDEPTQASPNSALGPAYDETTQAIPSEAQGPPVQIVTTAIPTVTQGPGVQHTSTFAPTITQGPAIQFITIAFPPSDTTPQGPAIQHDSEFIPGTSQGPALQHQTLSQLPVIENATVTQRDVLASFLVDVNFDTFYEPGTDLTLTVEWRRGTQEVFKPATAQTFDRKHDAEDTFPLLTGIPTASPGKNFNYVWQAFFDLPEGAFTDVFVRVTVDGSPTASVIVGPLSISTTVLTQQQALDQSQLRRSIRSRTPFDFLGCGILLPFRRGSRDIVNGCDVELIKSSVAQILGTRAAIGNFLGDLPWRPDFGSKLWVLRHRKNDPTLEGEAHAFVLEAMGWEPRVEVTQVTVEREPLSNPNELRIRVRYEIISENVDDNRVFLPEFEEVVTIG